MRLKLGQIFWMQDVNDFGGIGRSDFKCKVVGKKVCEFLDGTKFIDYLVERVMLNSYPVGYTSEDKRTHEETYRYDCNNKILTHWYEVNWPSYDAEWQAVKDKIFLTKPKKIRKGPYG